MLEVFSPPRIALEAKKHNIPTTSPSSLDLVTGWDYRRADHRNLAWQIVEEQEPCMVYLEPVCKAFTLMFRSNESRMDIEELRRIRAEGVAMLGFSAQLALHQIHHSRKCVFEHPDSASSWDTEALCFISSLPGVFHIVVDLCRFGLRVQGGELNQKPTAFLTNDAHTAAEITGRLFTRRRQHMRLENRRPQLAQIYPRLLVKALVRGLRASIEERPAPDLEQMFRDLPGE